MCGTALYTSRESPRSRRYSRIAANSSSIVAVFIRRSETTPPKVSPPWLVSTPSRSLAGITAASRSSTQNSSEWSANRSAWWSTYPRRNRNTPFFARPTNSSQAAAWLGSYRSIRTIPLTTR